MYVKIIHEISVDLLDSVRAGKQIKLGKDLEWRGHAAELIGDDGTLMGSLVWVPSVSPENL